MSARSSVFYNCSITESDHMVQIPERTQTNLSMAVMTGLMRDAEMPAAASPTNTAGNLLLNQRSTNSRVFGFCNTSVILADHFAPLVGTRLRVVPCPPVFS
jgi:hypothetical protein